MSSLGKKLFTKLCTKYNTLQVGVEMFPGDKINDICHYIPIYTIITQKI